MNPRLTLTLLFSCLIQVILYSQPPIHRIEPPNWWVGMHNPNVQLLIYGDDIGDLTPMTSHPGVEVLQTIKVANSNYLFVDLRIAKNAEPGTVHFDCFKGRSLMTNFTWELQTREPGSAQRQGFDNSDVLYLITPDRFANGDPSNDEIAGLKEKKNRSFKGGRHGGDIEGIRQHIDYISDMGFTAIWVNPVLENDMEKYSYHGYSTTDFYKVDPRFGSNESYRQLAKEAKGKGITLIMDMIVNHCGSEHWWIKDRPMKDWINTWPEYTQTNHQKSVVQDPYASQLDRKTFTDGWFVPTMPDLNQRNPLMANYLIQNAIWWVEYLGLAGIRMDTYPYPDMNYMTEWTRRVMEEYPNFNIVGEEWHGNPNILAYWQQGKHNPNGYTSSLRSLMDFPLQLAMVNALNEPYNDNTDFKALYEMLALDFVYAAPNELVVFPDNHDMSRIFSQVNEDVDLLKMALAYVCTTRGVPQLFYGTEVLMKNPGTTDHGIIRSDFPGGWPDDAVNAVTGEGLSEAQKDVKGFVRKLLNWRKNATVIHSGKLMHFIPADGLYVYFRYDDNNKVMVVLNKNAEKKSLDLSPFAEMLEGVSKGVDVLSGKTYPLDQELSLPGRGPLVLELK